ncbi:hypothetical protein [Hallella multisaccharivorax]|nr:hypothetical protein [Hallella multisaccharivorax]
MAIAIRGMRRTDEHHRFSATNECPNLSPLPYGVPLACHRHTVWWWVSLRGN